MRIFGLTGSIGMGKSVATRLLRRARVPVHDADAAVHRLLGPGGPAVAEIARVFPGTVRNGAIDRAKLGAQVFASADSTALRRLEAILHPLVRLDTRHWLATQARRRVRAVVLDVPLLFERGRASDCDAAIVVSAPRFLQRQRVLRRPGMSIERFEDIVSRQMPDTEKRRLASTVVTSGLGFRPTLLGLRAALRRAKRGRSWRPSYR
jgi:dephospho-CoA kinase